MSAKGAERGPVRARVLIVDDHPLVREGLSSRIAAQPDLEVCGEAADVDQALTLIRTTRPAVVLLDLALKKGSGLDLIKQITVSATGPKVLVISAYDEELYAERALRAGAHGYINKQELQVSIVEAIRRLLHNELFLSPRMTRRIAGHAVSGSPRPASGVDALTDRELEVFGLIGRGNTTRWIAEELRVSIHTIESHREKIRLKLGLRNGTELLQRAVLWVMDRHTGSV